MKIFINFLFLFFIVLQFSSCSKISSLFDKVDSDAAKTTSTTTPTATTTPTTTTTTTNPKPEIQNQNPYPIGQKVQVHWGKKWWKARVLKSQKNRWLISYAGYDHSWDEWVGPDRIRNR